VSFASISTGLTAAPREERKPWRIFKKLGSECLPDAKPQKHGNGRRFSARPVSILDCRVDADVNVSLGLEVAADGALAFTTNCLLGTPIVTLRDQR
jgi:hypothetical protein